MILRELAFRVINSPGEFLYEDTVEAYQFIVDSGLDNQLDHSQWHVMIELIESGQVSTPVFKF